MANLHDVDMSDAGELSEGFAPFPQGEYTFFMESSERRDTKAQDGEYLSCVFVVVEGEYKDRKVFHMFNLWNKNQQAVEIAKQQWRALCEATLGQPSAPGQDSSALHFKPFVGTINVKAAEGNYPAKNEFVFRKGKIRSVAGNAGAGHAPMAMPAAQPNVATQPVTNGAAAPTTTAAATPAAATASRPAWAR